MCNYVQLFFWLKLLLMSYVVGFVSMRLLYQLLKCLEIMHSTERKLQCASILAAFFFILRLFFHYS